MSNLFALRLKFFRQLLDDLIWRLASLARRMAEAAGAGSVLNVENHVVILPRRNSVGNMIEAQVMANLPGNNMVRARSISTYSHSAEYFSFCVVKREPAAEYDDASDRFTY